MMNYTASLHIAYHPLFTNFSTFCTTVSTNYVTHYFHNTGLAIYWIYDIIAWVLALPITFYARLKCIVYLLCIYVLKKNTFWKIALY